MKDIIVSGLEDSAVDRLQKRAEAHGWSLEDEIRHILTWGVEYIERVQTLTAGMKPMEKPKPLNDEAEALQRRKALREHLRKGHEEHERLMQEMDEEEDELRRLRKDSQQ